MGFENVPEEVLGEILGYLDQKDLKTAALVCKRFKDAAYDQITLPDVGKILTAIQSATKAVEKIASKAQKIRAVDLDSLEPNERAAAQAANRKRQEKIDAAFKSYDASLAEIKPLIEGLEKQSKRTKKFVKEVADLKKKVSELEAKFQQVI